MDRDQYRVGIRAGNCRVALLSVSVVRLHAERAVRIGHDRRRRAIQSRAIAPAHTRTVIADAFCAAGVREDRKGHDTRVGADGPRKATLRDDDRRVGHIRRVARCSVGRQVVVDRDQYRVGIRAGNCRVALLGVGVVCLHAERAVAIGHDRRRCAIQRCPIAPSSRAVVTRGLMPPGSVKTVRVTMPVSAPSTGVNAKPL